MLPSSSSFTFPIKPTLFPSWDKPTIELATDPPETVFSILRLDNSSLNKLVPSITKLNPNKSTSGHKHAGQEEVYVFYKGRGIMQIDDAKFEVKQGDVIPVPDGAFHRVFNDENEILEFAAIFNGERHTEDKPK